MRGVITIRYRVVIEANLSKCAQFFYLYVKLAYNEPILSEYPQSFYNSLDVKLKIVYYF